MGTIHVIIKSCLFSSNFCVDFKHPFPGLFLCKVLCLLYFSNLNSWDIQNRLKSNFWYIQARSKLQERKMTGPSFWIMHCLIIVLGCQVMLSQKQPSIGALIRVGSENMQQIYRRTPMPKCNFIHRHGCSLVHLLHIFRALFPKNTFAELLLLSHFCRGCLYIPVTRVASKWII